MEAATTSCSSFHLAQMDLMEQTRGNQKSFLGEASVVDEMYDMLTAYEMKVPTSKTLKCSWQIWQKC